MVVSFAIIKINLYAKRILFETCCVLALTDAEILVLGNRFFSWQKRTTNGSSFFWLEKNGFPRQDCRKGQELLQKKIKML
jgi:hypothetical protein